MCDKKLFLGWKGYWEAVNGQLGNDNQYTLAFGFSSKVAEVPFLAVKQNGNVPEGEDGEPAIVGMYPPPGWNNLGAPSIKDARNLAFKAGCGWKKGEAAGVHAEVLLIRAWMNSIGGSDKKKQFDAIASIGDSIYISASQPACWCCAALMDSMGIHYDKWTAGSKPITGWRHPLSNKTIPNSNLPKHQSSINKKFLADAVDF